MTNRNIIGSVIRKKPIIKGNMCNFFIIALIFLNSSLVFPAKERVKLKIIENNIFLNHLNYLSLIVYNRYS